MGSICLVAKYRENSHTCFRNTTDNLFFAQLCWEIEMTEPDFIDVLKKGCQNDLLPQTRIHQLPEFGHSRADVWVKREDESGFGISGCKKRKYASLLPWLLRERPPLVVLTGGAVSNHIVGFTQLLIENGVQFRLYLRQTGSSPQHGNALLRHLLAAEDQIRWVSTKEWPQVLSLAQREQPDALILPEGGEHPMALPGACTLWGDIRRNEQERGVEFDHIFIDSGTAFVAGALLGMKQLFRMETKLHIVLTAGDDTFFRQQYQKLQDWSAETLPSPFPDYENEHATFSPPLTAKSFGAVNRTVKDYLQDLARRYGLITDPIYTAKLFQTAESIIKTRQLQGRILIIHSGGGTGLMGFGTEDF